MYRSFERTLSVCAQFSVLFFSCFLPAFSAELAPPYTLSSHNGVLNVLIVAKASPLSNLPGAPTGWVYEVCARPAGDSLSCPPSAASPNFYGGTLLQLQKGDLLRIRLVNQLPAVADSKHANEPGMSYLALNPTNIHTHGMLVSPHGPTAANPTYGDNVFVLTFNSANGTPTPSTMLTSDVRFDYTDYEIKVPAGHPSGLFWFHPHAHGVSLNQMSAGLAGLITVGSLTDYLCTTGSCNQFLPKVGVQSMQLKDAQILAGGALKDQEDPSFCSGSTQLPAEPLGHCDGQDNVRGGGENYVGGHWYFTLNGQMYPTVKIKETGGQVWRIANESGSATYDLSLWNPEQKRNMLFQVLSIDGISVKPNASSTLAQAKEMSAGKFAPESCPGVSPTDPNVAQEMPLCTRRLHMMPASRAEIWVTYRDNADNVQATPNAGEFAVFRSNSYNTGPAGDTWPQIDLARVEFTAAPDPAMPAALSVDGDAISLLQPTKIAADPAEGDPDVHPDPTCAALPPGHIRRVFYGVPSADPNAFGLAWEELDAAGNVVGTPATDLIPFDPERPTICVPLGPGNTPRTERWQLVNVAAEDHNFHIHQTKFRVVGKDELSTSVVPASLSGKGVLMDNVPLPAAGGVCGSGAGSSGNEVLDWRVGLCTAKLVTVDIPFAIAGNFVYHCHILEHEDGGMMAWIRIRPNE